MEMKINFNKLFETNDYNSNTPSTTSLQNSYNFEEQSIISTSSNHIDLHYKFNEALFFDSEITVQNEHNLNILEDLSSIGRSFDESYQKQANSKNQYKSKKLIKHTYKEKQQMKRQEMFSKQTFGLTQKVVKSPGQRLYYEHKINEQRRFRELERIRIEKQEQQKKQITFKPAINEKSKKLLQLADSPLRKMQNLKKAHIKKQLQVDIKSSAQRKQQEELKGCTFHPVLNKTSKNTFTLNSLKDQKRSTKVFDQLYNDHKMKQIRRQKVLEQLQKRQKKMTQEQLSEFLQRNQDYLLQKLHKQELMRAVSSQYDLSSGRKLFEPKINDKGQSLLNNTSVKNLIKSSSSKKSGSILHDQQINQTISSKKIQFQTDKSRSGNSRNKKSNKSRSNSKKNESKSGTIKSLRQHIKSKTDNKLPLKSQGDQKLLKAKTNQNGFKPLPYQVSKIAQNNSQDQSQQKNEFQSVQRQGAIIRQTDNYQKPTSSIFNKVKATESVFQQRYQDSYDSDEKNDEINQFQQNWNENQQQEIFCQVTEDYQEDIYDAPQNFEFSGLNITKPNSKYVNDQDSNIKTPEKRKSKPWDQTIVKCDQTQQADSKDDNYLTKLQTQLPEQKWDRGMIVDQDLQSHDQQIEQQSQTKEQQEEKQQQMKSSFLKSIQNNPKINQKYQNLFQLQHDIDHVQTNSPISQTVKSIDVSSSSNDDQKDHRQIENIEQFKRLINELSQGVDESQQNLQETPQTHNAEKDQYKGLIVHDKLQDEKLDKLSEKTKKSWQQIFNSSSQFQHHKQTNPFNQQTGQNIPQKIRQSQLSQSAEGSPKKKPINIASLLKGKKKPSPRTQLN